MKSIMLSIQPKWVEKIASGEKTIEVRKNRPKLETPFKCYIYATWNGNANEVLVKENGKLFVEDFRKCSGLRVSGKVIGEFTCDRIICSQAYFDSQGKNHLTNVFPEDIKKTCLTEYELWNYIAGKAVKANEMYDGWLWHISDLKIYDKPKELSEFMHWKIYDWWDYGHYTNKPQHELETLENPPKSWCYVEEVGE